MGGVVDSSSPAEDTDGGFNKHKATIARLYLTEDKTLNHVRDIMASKYHFTASSKMYKARFKKWGWRKNIRFDRPLVLDNGPQIPPVQVAASVSTNIVTTDSDVFQETTGLIVRQNRLESYLRRRERRQQAELAKRLAPTPVAMKLPDRFRASQVVIVHVQQYILRRYTGKLSTIDTLYNMWASHVEHALFSWDRYTYAVTEALETPGRFQDAMVLLRRAPQELANMLSSQPVITTSDLCVFIAYMTRPRAWEDKQQRTQFYKLLRALLRVAASMFNWTSDHPMLRIFQGFLIADDEDFHQLAREAWKHGATTMDLFLDNLGPSGAPQTAMAKRSVASRGTYRASPDFICVMDETVRRARAGYDAAQPWCLESLHRRPEGSSPESSSSPSSSTAMSHLPGVNADQGPRSPVSESEIHGIANRVCKGMYDFHPQGGAKIIAMKALFDAHSFYGENDPVNRAFAEKYLRNCIAAIYYEWGKDEPLVQRYLAELESALLAWGETEKAQGVVRWREHIYGNHEQVSPGERGKFGASGYGMGRCPMKDGAVSRTSTKGTFVPDTGVGDIWSKEMWVYHTTSSNENF